MVAQACVPGTSIHHLQKAMSEEVLAVGDLSAAAAVAAAVLALGDLSVAAVETI